MSTGTLPAVREAGGTVAPSQLVRGVEPVVAAVEGLKAIRTFVASELKPDVDFGLIPGTGAKPTLLKPGAEKIALYYQTRIAYTIDRVDLGDGHLEVNVRCDLIHRGTGAIAAEGHGSCSTMESKYRWRKADRTCPACGSTSIIKGREEYGGGWLCFAKKGGCGTKFRDDDPAIKDQQTGRTENPDVWDARNTVLKMALKRSLVSAVLSLGSLSEMFTQDIEDIYDLPAQAAHVEIEQTRAPHADSRSEVNAAFPTPSQRAHGREPKRDSRPLYQLVADGVERTNQEFRSEFPDATRDPLNGYAVERHLLKFAGQQGWIEAPESGLKQAEVGKRLAGLYAGEHRNPLRRELATYLAAKLTEARNRQFAEAGQHDTHDAGDPDVDYPDEPGSNG